MGGRKIVNDLIRQELRRIRKRKGLVLAEVSSRAGMPLSSYACMEAGHYGISLENLSRILGALGTDIAEVWPSVTLGLEEEDRLPYSRRFQMFRLNEVVSLSGAAGGALLTTAGDHSRVLLQQALHDSEIEQLLRSVEQGRRREGLWFGSQTEDNCLLLYLEAQECPTFVKHLIRHYLTIWKQVFD